MRYRRIIVSIALLTVTTVTGLAQALSEKYNRQRPVIVVCDWDKPPYEFLNDQGDPTGSNIEVIEAVMRELGLPVKFVMKDWSTALKTFQRDEADIILANSRRYHKPQYAVSENIVNYNRIRVAMRTDTTGMITMKTLEREGAVFKPGDYTAYYFMDGDSIDYSKMEFQTPKVALMGLINGDYKYYVWGEEPLKWKIKELNLEGITLNDVGIPISEIHFVGRDRQLIEEIDDQYSRLKQSGEIALIQDRWFHPERINNESTPIYLYIAIAALLLAVLLYFLSRLAKAHVKMSTRASTELNEMMYKALHMGNFDVMQYDIAHDRVTNHYGDILPEGGLTLEEFTQRIHPDQREEFSKKMLSLMEGRERQFELNKRWNQGTNEAPHWLHFQGHAISELNNNGQPAYIINAIHDLTHEMEEDKAARNLVHKYNVLSNVPFVAMSFYDSKGFLVDLNDTMKKLCGITDENTELTRFWENVCMFDVALFRGIIDPDDRDDSLFCQHMHYPEFGINEYIECQIRPLFNAEGEIVNYLINTFNLTDERNRDRDLHLLERERRDIQKRIAQRHEQLYYLLENSERFIMRSNIAEETISLFRSPETPEYVHSFTRFLQILTEADREPVRRILNDTTTTTPQHEVIHLILPFEGQVCTTFSITFNPITDDDGHIIGHEGLATDISLQQAVGHQLEEQTKLANESMRMKSGFMASMTHELRTPLNAIVGFTGVLEALDDGDDRSEYLRIIRNSSDMLLRLINDIIDASSITDGSLAIKPENVNFVKSFDDICLTLEQRIQNPEVEFIKQNPYETFYSSLDIERLQQVLTNFVTNAVKFTQKGHIKVGYRYENHGLYLYCEDTGAGIPKNKQDIVFDRFVKLDEFVQGTGMGLAICKSIAEGCGGKIGVISEGKDKGSTFWVWIPCERRLSE
ncbi:MAG: transporter substrate-binding domain-containing protein [Prevotella sp.]|nr:transporter substrate-binding domain-containing protein [Prevotella sp.]